MTLEKLIAVADGAYPEGLVARAHKGEDTGDTLALFVARELADIHDSDASDAEQTAIAANAMRKAAEELLGVCAALTRVLGEVDTDADLIAVAQAVLDWAAKPRDHGGNPYGHKFVQMADDAMAKINGDTKHVPWSSLGKDA